MPLALALALPGKLTAVANHAGELTYEVAPEDLLTVATVLRDAPDLKFEMCMDVCGVDYLSHGHDEWNTQSATSSGFSRGVARGGQRVAALAAGPALRGRLSPAVHFPQSAGCACGCFAPTTNSPWSIP